MAIKRIIIGFMLLFLVGCQSMREKPPTIRTVEVLVPVNQCPDNHLQIERPTRPELAIQSLTEEDSTNPGKVVRSYKATVKQLQGYASQLENGFDAYRGSCTKPPEGENNEEN